MRASAALAIFRVAKTSKRAIWRQERLLFRAACQHNAGMVKGIVFDLDGTLADSQLDFDAMRREMELPLELPILEALDRLEPIHAAHCRSILDRHEWAGAERATLLPGVADLFAALQARGLRQAVATRNSRRITEATLARLGLAIKLALTRDDGPVKPDPWAVLHVCQQWGLRPEEIVVIGD